MATTVVLTSGAGFGAAGPGGGLVTGEVLEGQGVLRGEGWRGPVDAGGDVGVGGVERAVRAGR
jgi:hypothetical protein